MDIAGTGAVVTGAGSGIGRGIALAMANAGAGVIVADIEPEKAHSVALEIKALGGKAGHFAVDVRDSSAVSALADYAWSTLGRVDILCNNAGVCMPGMALDVGDADLRWQFEVNVFGVFNGMREFTRRFAAQGGQAWIVNTGSHHSVGAPTKGVSIYVATKHAVLGLADAFRTEFGPTIGYSVLCPGIINTSLWNAGRNRPGEFGGKVGGDPRNAAAQASFGMDPERVGTLVTAGIIAEDPYIWTHPQDIELIEKRYSECRDTLARQWPDGPGAEHMMTPHDVS